MKEKPNIVFILADQLRAASLPLYGKSQIKTPNIDRLAASGIVFDNAISSSPVCTPYRAMLLTGRHPQSTGHVINFVGSRYDEIGIGDVFSASEYETAWVGKWHLQTGAWPGGSMGEGEEGPCYIPEGRERLGFKFWRAYNFHEHYYKGWVNIENWRNETWQGYETEALNRYGMQFMDESEDKPFCLFLSPHQPHKTCVSDYAPEKYYKMLPEKLKLPENVSEAQKEESLKYYRHYLAMTLAIDDMVGEILDYLTEKDLLKSTIIVFSSDHGSQFGAQDIGPWQKDKPFEDSIKVPLIVALPDGSRKGERDDMLIAPVDILPTLCGLCGIPVPSTVEGIDLSSAILGNDRSTEQDAVLLMSFCEKIVFAERNSESVEGLNIWRGVRTKQFKYFKFLDGREGLYHIVEDPLELHNLVQDAAHGQCLTDMREKLQQLLDKRGDRFPEDTDYTKWFDHKRRVVENASGHLGDPEKEPDWALLNQ